MLRNGLVILSNLKIKSPNCRQGLGEFTRLRILIFLSLRILMLNWFLTRQNQRKHDELLIDKSHRLGYLVFKRANQKKNHDIL